MRNVVAAIVLLVMLTGVGCVSYRSNTTTTKDPQAKVIAAKTQKEMTIHVGHVSHKAPTLSETGQHVQTFSAEIQKQVQIDYLLYLPENYKASKETYPLMLFLHGAGERGKNLEALKVHGPPMLADKGKSFPFVLVSPQCPEGDWWTDSKQIETLNALLDDIVSRYRIDKDRIYVTGLSMGGFGTWQLAIQYPDRFAAIAPVCGGGDPLLANRLGPLPIWVFHGAKDSVVPFKKSEEMVEALKKAGNNVKFTVYPETDHNSWTETYNNPKLYEWFLQQKRSDKK